MIKTNCYHCGAKLGDFLYADACPHCHCELQHNTRHQPGAPIPDPNRRRAWPIRCFQVAMRLLES